MFVHIVIIHEDEIQFDHAKIRSLICQNASAAPTYFDLYSQLKALMLQYIFFLFKYGVHIIKKALHVFDWFSSASVLLLYLKTAAGLPLTSLNDDTSSSSTKTSCAIKVDGFPSSCINVHFRIGTLE